MKSAVSVLTGEDHAKTARLSLVLCLMKIMVIFVITKNGFNEIEDFIKNYQSPVWVGDGVLSVNELDELRKSGLDITNFNYQIDKENEDEILGAIETIKEHHPGHSIWTEH